MTVATVDEFLARITEEEHILGPLLGVPSGGSIGDPQRQRIQDALDDASAELDGYKPRMSVGAWPADATLRVHEIKVAMYLLTLGRPGAEFEQIRNAYNDTIKFYTDAIAAANADGGTSPLAGSAVTPDRVFTEKTLKGFV